MITINKINKEIEYGDPVIIHRKYIGVIKSKCEDGYLIKWFDSHIDGTFYKIEESQVKNLIQIEILINNEVLTGDFLLKFLNKVINNGITLNENTLQLSWDFLTRGVIS